MTNADRAILQLSAADHIVTCRDFCGNENDCLRDFEYENKIAFTPQERGQIRLHVSGVWRISQKEAGVKSKYHTHGTQSPNYIMSALED